jgi:hypothetical protein
VCRAGPTRARPPCHRQGEKTETRRNQPELDHRSPPRPERPPREDTDPQHVEGCSQHDERGHDPEPLQQGARSWPGHGVDHTPRPAKPEGLDQGRKRQDDYEKQAKGPGSSHAVALHSTMVRCTCHANGGPAIRLLGGSPTRLGGEAWTPQPHAAPTWHARPEATSVRALWVSRHGRRGAASARRVARRAAPPQARPSRGCAPRQRRSSSALDAPKAPRASLRGTTTPGARCRS